MLSFSQTMSRRDHSGCKVDVDALSRWLDGRSFEDCKQEFDEHGYIILKNVLTETEVENIRSALEPHLNKLGRNNFEGFKTNRVYSLLKKSPDIFSELVTHPLALAFVESDLGRSALLSALLAINLLPGESVQDWHHDDNHLDIPLPHPSYGISTFWAIDPMTEDNGATELIPGSHKWSELERPSTLSHEDNLNSERGIDDDPFKRDDSIKAIMPTGSLMILKGTTFHRGGANKSDRARLIVTPQYCPGWARQLENMLLSTPPDIAAKLPKRVRELLGYSIHGAFMGYVDGRHPDTIFDR